MTYLYYKTSTLTSNTKPNEKTINQWQHLADKKIARKQKRYLKKKERQKKREERKKKAAEKRAQYLKDNPRAFRGF